MLEAILAKVHQALNRIGQSSDAASSTGSLHAKVTNVQNTVNTIASGVVKSVQRGVVTFSATGTTNITISAVNTSKAVLHVNGNQYTNSSYGFQWHAVLTNSTTVSITCDDLGNIYSTYVAWQVIEYA